jgi:Dolichyl-phosphate-mannose-protein mannosyltransferase
MSTAAVAEARPDSGSQGSEHRLLQRWLLGLLALGILWRVARYLLQFPFWGDEAFICLNMVDMDYMGLTGQLRCAQVAPLLFLWGELTAFFSLGHSELAMRLLPFLAGMGGLLLTWRLAHLTLSPLARTFAVAFLAVAIWPVSMGTLIKPYSLDLLMAGALLVPAVQFLQRPDRPIWLLVLALVIPVAIFASYPSVFVAGGVSLALLTTAARQPGWKARTAFLLYNVLLFASFVGSYLLVGLNQLDRTNGSVNTYLQDYWAHGFPPAVRPHPNNESLGWTEEGVPGFLIWFVRINTGRLFAYPLGGSDGLSAGTTLLFLVGLAVFWRQKQRSLLVLFVTPFALGLAAAFLVRYPYGGCCRLSQHVAPIICVLAGAGAAALVDRVRSIELRRRWITGVCSLFALVGVGGALTDAIWPYRGESDVWARKLVHSLSARCGPDDQITVLNAEAATDVVFRWELTRHQLRGGYVGWEGKLDPERLRGKSGQVWVLNVATWDADKPPHLPPEPSRLDIVREDLHQSHRTWLLANHIPYTVIPRKKNGQAMQCEVYRWTSPTNHSASDQIAISCWP